jgi:hypothetical protein
VGLHGFHGFSWSRRKKAWQIFEKTVFGPESFVFLASLFGRWKSPKSKTLGYIGKNQKKEKTASRKRRQISETFVFGSVFVGNLPAFSRGGSHVGPREIHQNPSKFVGLHGALESPWKSKEIHENPGKIDGNPWRSIENPLKSIENRGKSIENRWKSMEIQENSWKPIENPWKSMEIHDNPWKSMEIHGNPREWMEIHGNGWKSMDIGGSVRKCVGPWKFHGNPWNSRETHENPSKIHGNPWKSTEIPGNPRQSMAIHGNPWKSSETHQNPRRSLQAGVKPPCLPQARRFGRLGPVCAPLGSSASALVFVSVRYLKKARGLLKQEKKTVAFKNTFFFHKIRWLPSASSSFSRYKCVTLMRRMGFYSKKKNSCFQKHLFLSKNALTPQRAFIVFFVT